MYMYSTYKYWYSTCQVYVTRYSHDSEVTGAAKDYVYSAVRIQRKCSVPNDHNLKLLRMKGCAIPNYAHMIGWREREGDCV